jgi:predicted nucleotidyltransferase
MKELQEVLREVCNVLNKKGVRYVVVGGCAVILHGYFRTTNDIDLLVDPSSENVAKIREALYEIFEEEEVWEIGDEDIQKFTVLRYVPQKIDITIDLMARIGSVDIEKALEDVDWIDLDETRIPLCGLTTLIETKKGVRPKDKDDLLFLRGKKEYVEEKNKK